MQVPDFDVFVFMSASAGTFLVLLVFNLCAASVCTSLYSTFVAELYYTSAKLLHAFVMVPIHQLRS